jgi:hypothetical protein
MGSEPIRHCSSPTTRNREPPEFRTWLPDNNLSCARARRRHWCGSSALFPKRSHRGKPIDYANYKKFRAGLALPQGSLLPINPPSAGAPFGLHPRMVEIQSLFNSQHAAVLANVGTLISPTTRAGINNAALPNNLFSHEDQQEQMQTATFSSEAQTGWAGRTADKVQSLAGGGFPMIFLWRASRCFARD